MKKAAVVLLLVLAAGVAIADRARPTIATTQSRMMAFSCNDTFLGDAGWRCEVYGECRTATRVLTPCDQNPVICSMGPLTMAGLNACRTTWHNANTE
jgi:hypothetical protein